MNNVIDFSAYKAAAPRSTGAGNRNSDNVVSMEDWKSVAHARRTATGVYFHTSVLATTGANA